VGAAGDIIVAAAAAAEVTAAVAQALQ